MEQPKCYAAYLTSPQRDALRDISDAFRRAASAETGPVRPQFLRLSDAFDRIYGTFYHPLCTPAVHEASARRIDSCLKATRRLLRDALKTAVLHPAARPVAEELARNLIQASYKLAPVSRAVAN